MTPVETAALVLAAAPLAMTLCNLTVFRTPAPSNTRPPVSVLIPMRNEESNAAAIVTDVLTSRGVELELIVLDDHSTDRTPEILAAIGDPRLRVAPAPALPPGWSGKQHACAALATLARHDLMVFVDADVRLAPDALARIAGYMQRHDVGLASGFPRQVVRTWSERLLLPLIHFLLLGYLPMPAMLLLRASALGAGCGQLMAVRRAAYRTSGGHAAIRASLHDGLMLPRAFRAAGIMTGLFDASSFASCRMYRSAVEVWEGLTKNATEGMAKPLALPAWTAVLGGGAVLPLVLLSTAPSLIALAALGLGILTRLLLAWRFRQPPESAFLHPFGVAALLALQWVALVRATAGRQATWRGRAYPAQ